jgi:dTDP-glucose 4,6-dehydratase
MTKRILLTGISGFHASHVFEHIMSTTDWFVVGTYRNNTAGELERIEDILKTNPEWKQRLKMFRFDFNDEIHEQTAKKIGPVEYIIHIAASSHVDRSITHPKQFLWDNVESTVNILEWARQLLDEKYCEAVFNKTNFFERFLYFSTDEVFGNALGGEDHTEEYPHRPRNPYAASKAAAEDFCHAYQETYGIPLLITNTMNLTGERQNPEKYIPLCIKRSLTGEKIYIHGYPDGSKAGSRKYIHCRNAADGLLYVLKNAPLGERYNIVGEVELDNLEVAQMVHRIVKEFKPEIPDLNYEIVDFHSSRPGHDLRYSLDGTKLAELGWKPRVSFEDSLRNTIKWTLERQEEWL